MILNELAAYLISTAITPRKIIVLVVLVVLIALAVYFMRRPRA